MRHPARAALLALLLAAASLGGCSGFSIGVRQDEEDQARLFEAVAARGPGDRFPARALLDRRWTRLFVFRGGIATQAVEDRIAIPFPQSGEETPRTSSYLVFADDEQVISAFSLVTPPGVGAGCLLADRAPLTPGTPLTLVPDGSGGGSRLSTVAAAGLCR